MEATELKALIRKETGKGPARRFRDKGFLPAVFYARGEDAIPLSLNDGDLRKVIKGKSENVFIKLLIEGGDAPQEKICLIKEMQVEPLSRQIYHVDFYEIRMDQKLTIDVPLHFVGVPVGVENGGELQHLKREVKVSCLPTSLPDFIEVDVTGLDIGHSIKVQDLKIPEGMTILDAPDAGVAIVATVKMSVPQAAEAAAGDQAAGAAKGDAKA